MAQKLLLIQRKYVRRNKYVRVVDFEFEVQIAYIVAIFLVVMYNYDRSEDVSIYRVSSLTKFRVIYSYKRKTIMRSSA